MTTESQLAALTTSTTALTTAVGTQQTSVANAVATFAATTARVNALNNVSNTADANKPISIAEQAALDAKQATLVSGLNIKRVNNVSLLGSGDIVIVRSATSLNRIAYDDRANLRATTSQVDDATLVEGLGLFMWTNTQAEPDDDETCFNTPAVGASLAGQWVLQLPAWDLIDAWNMIETSIADDWREDEPARMAAYILANK